MSLRDKQHICSPKCRHQARQGRKKQHNAGEIHLPDWSFYLEQPVASHVANRNLVCTALGLEKAKKHQREANSSSQEPIVRRIVQDRVAENKQTNEHHSDIPFLGGERRNVAQQFSKYSFHRFILVTFGKAGVGGRKPAPASIIGLTGDKSQYAVKSRGRRVTRLFSSLADCPANSLAFGRGLFAGK